MILKNHLFFSFSTKQKNLHREKNYHEEERKNLMFLKEKIIDWLR